MIEEIIFKSKNAKRCKIKKKKYLQHIFKEFVKVLRHEGQIKFVFLEVGSLSSVNFVGIKVFILYNII